MGAYRRPRTVFCANAGARLCPAAIGRVTEPVTALLARSACSPCDARTGACVPRRGTGPIPRHDASRFAPLGWTGRRMQAQDRTVVKNIFRVKENCTLSGTGEVLRLRTESGFRL